MTGPRKTVARALRALAGLLAAAMLAGCASSAGVSAASEPPQPPMSHTDAAEHCWMSTERTDAHLPLDQRLALVDRCIAEKTGTPYKPPNLPAETARKKTHDAKSKNKSKKTAQTEVRKKRKRAAPDDGKPADDKQHDDKQP